MAVLFYMKVTKLGGPLCPTHNSKDGSGNVLTFSPVFVVAVSLPSVFLPVSTVYDVNSSYKDFSPPT